MKVQLKRFRFWRLSALVVPLLAKGPQCILVKEMPGCLSLWNAADGQKRLDQGVDLVQSKMWAGKLEGRLDEVQLLGRLLSTRHKPVQLAGRGRLLIPEGFRQFLRVEPNSDLLLVGAAVCIEIWNPTDWMAHLEGQMPQFNKLFDNLTS